MYGESNILLGWYRGLSKEVLNSSILNLLVHTLRVIPSAKIRMGERGKSTFCQVERRKIEKREVWKSSSVTQWPNQPQAHYECMHMEAEELERDTRKTICAYEPLTKSSCAPRVRGP